MRTGVQEDRNFHSVPKYLAGYVLSTVPAAHVRHIHNRVKLKCFTYYVFLIYLITF